MKSNYFKIFLMVSIISGFQEKSFGSNIPQPAAGAAASSEVVGGVKTTVSVVSKPSLLVFESVPQIHSVAYYYNRAIKWGYSWRVDRVRDAIKQQMAAAWYVIAKNIEKQKNAGLPFTDADLKKFQLSPIFFGTRDYYENRQGKGYNYFLGYASTARSNNANQALDLQNELASYTKSLNDDLTARMRGTISSVPVDPAKKIALNVVAAALSAEPEDEEI